jgi:ABC-type molybdate transport system substrate-binding protein
MLRSLYFAQYYVAAVRVIPMFAPLCIGWLLAGRLSAPASAAEPVMIFAAATLKDALDAVDAAAETSTHVEAW